MINFIKSYLNFVRSLHLPDVDPKTGKRRVTIIVNPLDRRFLTDPEGYRRKLEENALVADRGAAKFDSWVAELDLPTKTDEQIRDLLREIVRRWAARHDEDRLLPQAFGIGVELNRRGGIQAMRHAHASLGVPASSWASWELDRVWEGIGRWRPSREGWASWRAELELSRKSDVQIMELLRGIARRWVAGDDEYKLYHQAWVLGEEFHRRGGIEAMRRAYSSLDVPGAEKALDRAWDRISYWTTFVSQQRKRINNTSQG